MRGWSVRLLCAFVILLLLAGLGYGAVWISTVPNPLQTLLPPLLLGFGGRAGVPVPRSGPPPPAHSKSGPPPPPARRHAPPPERRSGPPPPPARRHAPPPARRQAPPPLPAASGHSPPPPEQKTSPEGGNTVTGNAAAAPPPCGPCGSVEETVTRKILLLLRCGISVLSFSSPVIVHWSLGSSLPETITFHSLLDLIATTAACLAWLLFAITQLHIEGNRVLGAEALVVNLMGAIVYTLCTVIKMAGAANVQIKGCIGAVLALCGPTLVVVCFIVFGPWKRDSPAAVWISYGAALVQMLSQLLPLWSFCLLCSPPADAPAQHENTKKLIIFSRSCNLIVCVYWAMYCILTYQHSFFELANVVSAVLAFITFILHLIYALEPQAAV